jgi:tetratricopeptide (TPR) repeat protein
MTRMRKPGRLLSIAFVAYLLPSFGCGPIRARADDAPPRVKPAQHGRREKVILDRLNGGFFALREDVVHKMVSNALSKAEIEEALHRTPRGIAAWKALTQADAQWSKGKRAIALKEWNALAERYAGTAAAFEAQFNIAQADRLSGDRRGAIDAYVKLIQFPAPTDPEAGAELQCTNEKHYSCAELSDMFLETGDLASAARYADLALNRYELSDMCGVWLSSHNELIRDRIAAIKSAIANGDPVGIKPRIAD